MILKDGKTQIRNFKTVQINYFQKLKNTIREGIRKLKVKILAIFLILLDDIKVGRKVKEFYKEA